MLPVDALAEALVLGLLPKDAVAEALWLLPTDDVPLADGLDDGAAIGGGLTEQFTHASRKKEPSSRTL